MDHLNELDASIEELQTQLNAENGVAPEVPVQQPVETPVAQPATPVEQPVAQEPVVQEPVSQEPVEKTNPFSINYGGAEHQLPDPDGFLGRGSVENLKKTAATGQYHIAKIEDENKTYRQQIAEYERKLKEATQPATIQQPVPDPVSQQPVQEQHPMPTIDNIPDDPLNWRPEDALVIKKNFEENEKKLAKLEEFYNASMKEREQQQKTVEQQQAEKKAKAFWDNYNSFGKKVYGIENIQEKNKEVEKFMDGIAYSNDCTVDKYGDPQAYAAERQRLTERYLNGDPLVTSKTTHLSRPDKISEFLKAAKVGERRNELIKSGRLTEQSTIEDAWLIDQNDSGKLEAFFNKTTQENFSQGLKTKQNSLVETMNEQSQYAKPIDGQANVTVEPALDANKMLEQFRSNPSLGDNPEFMASMNKAIANSNVA